MTDHDPTGPPDPVEDDPAADPRPDPMVGPTPDDAAPADAAPADGGAYEEGTLGAVPSEEEGAPVAPSDDDEEEGPAPEPDPLAAAEAQRDAFLDQLQRARADYDNLNKRRHREVAEARDRGQASLVEGLLEVLDNFGFALRAAEISDDIQLAKGVQLVHDQLLGALERAGLEHIPGAGATFDPSHHEALMSEPDGVARDQPEVLEVLRSGYRFKSHLLRPASVKVTG